MNGKNRNLKKEQDSRNRKRRIAAVLIVAVLLVGVVPLAAFAQDGTAQPLAEESVLEQPPADNPAVGNSLPQETPAEAAASGTASGEMSAKAASAGENAQNAEIPIADALYVTVTTNGANSLDVSWTAITGATNYEVFRSEDGVNFASIGTTGQTNFPDIGLVADTQYWYKVVANNGPEGTGSGKTDAEKTQAPLNLRVTGYGEYNNNANLAWSASAGADDYYIYRSTSQGSGYSYVGNSAGATTYSNTGLGYNTTYYYYVTAVKNGIESAPSNTGSLTTGAPTLTVTVSNPTTSSLNVSWPPIPGAGSYTLYRSLDGVNYEEVRVSYVTSYADAGLQAGTHYWYKVVSDNGIEGTGDGWTLPDRPDAPLNLKAELTGTYHLDARLTWSPVAGADGYRIYMSRTQSGTYSQIGATQSGVTEYMDAGLDFNTTYYYKVTAVKRDVEGDPSNIASVTTSRPVLNVAVSNPTTNSLDVSWNAIPRATSYTVYRSLDGVDYSTLVGTYQGTGFADTGRDPDTNYWYKVVASNRIEGIGSGKTFPVPAAVYTVIFDGNGATTPANPSRMTVTTPQTHLSAFPAPPQRTGYSFAGWYTQKTGGTQFTMETTVTGDITVYAHWNKTPVPASYTVYFDGNGADVQADPTSLRVTVPDTTVKALPAQPSRAGYGFIGWNTQADGRGNAFDSATAITRDMTVYAQWKAVYYSLRFDLNGGSGAVPQTQSLRMGDLAQAVSAPTRSGYTFLGWNVNSNGTGAWWDFGATMMPAADVTLYAQWREDAAPPAPAPTTPNTDGGTTPDSSPKTSDEANWALWIMLLMAAGGTIAGATFYRRKRKKVDR